MKDSNVKVLVSSPVRQSPFILKEFLLEIAKIDRKGIELDYLFINDNTEDLSFRLLNAYSVEGSKVILWDSEKDDNYLCDEKTHHWNDNLFSKVASFKNRMIEYAMSNKYDYIFFIDSDILIRSETVLHLISQKKEIISEIFWTKWKPDHFYLPQVWLYDQKTMHEPDDFKNPNEGTIEFLKKLSNPGVYKVGGLGACTLISRSAMEKGVNFNPIYNVRFLRGEDRFFCVRAAVLGIELYVDTHYPAYHIYRKSDLAGIDDWRIGKFVPGCQF